MHTPTEYAVFFTGPDHGPAFRRVTSLDEAVQVVEHLRNELGVLDANVHSLALVPLVVPHVLPRRGARPSRRRAVAAAPTHVDRAAASAYQPTSSRRLPYEARPAPRPAAPSRLVRCPSRPTSSARWSADGDRGFAVLRRARRPGAGRRGRRGRSPRSRRHRSLRGERGARRPDGLLRPLIRPPGRQPRKRCAQRLPKLPMTRRGRAFLAAAGPAGGAAGHRDVAARPLRDLQPRPGDEHARHGRRRSADRDHRAHHVPRDGPAGADHGQREQPARHGHRGPRLVRLRPGGRPGGDRQAARAVREGGPAADDAADDRLRRSRRPPLR